MQRTLELSKQDFSVRAYALEDFLFVFNSQAARDRAMAAGGVPISATQLIFNQWMRLAGANPGTLYFRVDLEIEGIPPQAWHLSLAYQLLS